MQFVSFTPLYFRIQLDDLFRNISIIIIRVYILNIIIVIDIDMFHEFLEITVGNSFTFSVSYAV